MCIRDSIEAALIGRNIAPGLNRKFTAEEWEAIPQKIWKEERKAAFEAIDYDADLEIYGFDLNSVAVKNAIENAEEAGVEDCIHFAVGNAERLAESDLAGHTGGVIITNPPYGERIGNQAAIDKIYQGFYSFFRQNKSWSLFMVTSDKSCEKKVFGRPADRRRKLFNGRLEVCYYQFHGEKPEKN